MTGPASRPAARPGLVHGTLLAGSTLISVALVGFTAYRGPTGAATSPVFFIYFPFLFAIPAVGVAFVFRQLCAPQAPGTSLDQWWSSQGGKALACWGLLESTAIVGAMFHMLTGSLLPLIVTAAGLMLLALSGPDRLNQP